MSLCPHGYTLNWDCPVCEGDGHVVVISADTESLLAANSLSGELAGHRVPLPGRRYEIILDGHVWDRLLTIDPDPDIAIRKLLASGVGHA